MSADLTYVSVTSVGICDSQKAVVTEVAVRRLQSVYRSPRWAARTLGPVLGAQVRARAAMRGRGHGQCERRRATSAFAYRGTISESGRRKQNNKPDLGMRGVDLFYSPRFVIYMSPPRSTSKFISQSTYSAFISRGL